MSDPLTRYRAGAHAAEFSAGEAHALVAELMHQPAHWDIKHQHHSEVSKDVHTLETP